MSYSVGILFVQWVLYLVERRVVVCCQVGIMFADEFRRFKKVFVCSFILVGLSWQSSMAATIIDLQKQQPLGVMTTNGARDQVVFSLGNGRALLIPIANNKKKNGPVVRDHLLLQDVANTKTRPVAVRRFKRNLKW